MPVNEFNGKIEGVVTTSELIDYIKKHQDIYGDTAVVFCIEGERNVSVQFEHFKNALTIDLNYMEEEDDE